jgi:hypothetical protein
MTRYSNAFDDGPGDAAARCEAHASLWLTERLRLDAEENGRKARLAQFTRADGWNSQKVRAFLFSLAECGVVSDAAQAAGISRAAAYKLRDRGPAFRLAWDAALRIARRRLTDELMSRAMRGCVELIYRDGKLWEERHRHDNRLGLALLTRLDRLARRDDRETGHTQRVCQGFDEFVDLVAAGGEGAEAFLTQESRRCVEDGRFARVAIALTPIAPRSAPCAETADSDENGAP